MQEYIFHFGQWWALYVLIPVLLVVIIIRIKWQKPVIYRYSLSSVLAQAGKTSSDYYRLFFAIVRVIVLLLLIFITAQPHLVDQRSKITVEGIDIVLALDVSGSMQFVDHRDDPRSRIEVAQDEAVAFVEKRTNDAVGLVIFGNDALSRCPLTYDKKVVRDIIKELRIGVIDQDGTLLSRGLLTAVNRLKKSKAKSKIIILLTDGEPSEGDIEPSVAVEAAKQLGIKIYTIGIGSDEQQVIMHPIYGPIPKPRVNRQLLTAIADQTGGQFFLARNPQDMRTIYDTIDQLETVKYETPVFSKQYDISAPLCIAAVMILLISVICSTFVWRYI
jgi:Ca-activated chloride channel family protein